MSNLRDVAKLSNVSLATASRILSGDETFKTTNETKERVENAASELNYIFKSRARGKKFNIACILAVTSEKYGDPFFNTILSSAEEEGAKLGITIAAIKNYTELSNPSALDEICAQNLDGLIIMEELPKHVLEKLKKHIPHIVGIDPYNCDFNNVGFDHITATYQVMDHFIATDCKHIAYIGGGSPNLNFNDSKRMIAYREALRKAGLPYDESLIIDCDWNIDQCAEETKKLLLEHPEIDAIFAGSDSLASAILGTLYSMNISCPEQISVIGFNNISIAAHMVPSLSTIDVPTKEIGKHAILRLYELMTNKDDSILKILLPTRFIERNSTKRIRKENL